MNISSDKDSYTNDKQLKLITEQLQRDYLFSIEAFNPVSKLSVRLFQTVLVRIGINTDLQVDAREENAGSYTVGETAVTINYGAKAVVRISEVQSGTKYQLCDANYAGTDKNASALSDPISSNDTSYLEITTKDALQEDTTIKVEATNIHTDKHSYLDPQPPKSPIPALLVYPNTGLNPTVEVSEEDNSTANITLNNTQKSAVYFLSLENILEDTDDFIIKKEALADANIADRVQGNDNTITWALKKLTDDVTVSITAKKINSGLEKKLPELLFIPVKLKMSIVEKDIKSGGTATIQVSHTQAGVFYQLRKVNSNNTYTNIGNPVYHHRNRSIGQAHIGTDFVVGTFTGDTVLLPTGNIDQTTTFNVLATKDTTGLQVEIGNITVEIKG